MSFKLALHCTVLCCTIVKNFLVFCLERHSFVCCIECTMFFPVSFYSVVQLDINECKDAEKNTCEQDCVNTRGGFQCFCKRGFIIDPKDASKCLGMYT